MFSTYKICNCRLVLTENHFPLLIFSITNQTETKHARPEACLAIEGGCDCECQEQRKCG